MEPKFSAGQRVKCTVNRRHYAVGTVTDRVYQSTGDHETHAPEWHYMVMICDMEYEFVESELEGVEDGA